MQRILVTALLALSASILSASPSSLFEMSAYAQVPPRSSIPSFRTTVHTEATAEAFQSFVDKHRGSLVYLNFEASNFFSRIGGKTGGSTDFVVSSDVCTPDQCDGDHFMLSGNDFSLLHSGGSNLLTGYFVIDKDIEMHLGRYFGLRSSRQSHENQ